MISFNRLLEVFGFALFVLFCWERVFGTVEYMGDPQVNQRLQKVGNDTLPSCEEVM